MTTQDLKNNMFFVVIVSLLVGGAIGFFAGKEYTLKNYSNGYRGNGQFYNMMRDRNNIPYRNRMWQNIDPNTTLPDRSTQPTNQ